MNRQPQIVTAVADRAGYRPELRNGIRQKPFGAIIPATDARMSRPSGRPPIDGATGDLPAPGNYDGDGLVDAVTHRPSNLTWCEQRTANVIGAVSFRAASDVPVPNAFVR